MPTNLAIDDALLLEAKRIGKHKTKRETVEAALRDYVLRHRRRQILNLFGTIEFDADHDYKRDRRRKPA